MELLSSNIKEKSEVALVIGITPDELDSAVNKAYLKNRNRIAVPGFRKGKAPRKMIEKIYGISVFLNDALDSLLPDVLKFTLDGCGFDIVGYPKVTDIELKDNDTRAEITLLAARRPEVKLGKYKGLSAPKQPLDVPESEIMREIEALQNRNARLEPVERPAAKGDVTVINFEGFLDGEPFEGGKGENFELELGSGRFIPGFEDKLTGMVIDEEREIDLVFPEDYKEDLAGKPVVFKVKLLELKEKQLPELDDEFAKDVSEFDTLEEYKASIREKIERSRQAEIDDAFEGALMEQLIADMQAEIPETMIEENLDKAANRFARQVGAYGMKPEQYLEYMGIDKSTFKERMRGDVEKQVRISLALEEIAKLEGIKITEEEIEEEYRKSAEEMKTDVEKVKESVAPEAIENNLKLRAAAKIVTGSAKAEKVKEKDKDKDKDKSKEKENK